MLVITVYSPPPLKKTYVKYLQAVRNATRSFSGFRLGQKSILGP